MVLNYGDWLYRLPCNHLAYEGLLYCIRITPYAMRDANFGHAQIERVDANLNEQ